MKQPRSIRHEAEADAAAIRRLLARSFPTAAEADLVERLRAEGDLMLALVAEDAGEVVGYAAFSVMSAPFVAVGLAPVAVDVDNRRKGIATAMILTGLGELRAIGVEAAFVLGEPAYYTRFGFDAAAAAGFETPYAGPFFMVASLAASKLPASTGAVAYPAAFADLQ